MKALFDVTIELNERPLEAVFGFVDSQLVLCALRKSIGNDLQLAAMWEVKNGLHIAESISVLSRPMADGQKSIDALLLAFGNNHTNLSKIVLVRTDFSNNSIGEFFEFVANTDLKNVVSKSRLSEKMKQQLRTEAETIGAKH